MTLIPLSALAMASSALFKGNVDIFGLSIHPITAMMVVGIAIQGLAECFLSPKYLEFASKQAPPGKEGVFLGFAHVNTFFAWIFGFIFSGFLLARTARSPPPCPAAVQAQHAAALAGQGPDAGGLRATRYYLWFAYAGVGVLIFIALLAYVRSRIDRRADSRSDRQVAASCAV